MIGKKREEGASMIEVRRRDNWQESESQGVGRGGGGSETEEEKEGSGRPCSNENRIVSTWD